MLLWTLLVLNSSMEITWGTNQKIRNAARLTNVLISNVESLINKANFLHYTKPANVPHAYVQLIIESATGAEIKDFLHEIKLMNELGKHVHENVIQMYACCTVNSPVCLLMEYASGGNLLVYLRSLKQKSEEKAVLSTNVENKSMTESEQEKFGSSIKLSEFPEEWKAYSKSSSHANVEQVQARNTEIAEKVSQACQTALDPKELESFARQIVNGMTHVAGLGIVHRDLAARNILLGQNNVLKISDFGLSREAGIYVMNANGKIPFRWLSVEAIKERRYSSASDVWAFGIVLCEIFTLGDVPYASMDDNDVLGFLERGNRMKKAKSCSDEIYALMLKCWSHWPEERPTFPELSNLLRELEEEDHSYINVDTLMMSSPSSAANGDNGSDNDTQQDETILSPVDLACGSIGIQNEVFSPSESEEQSFLSPIFKFPDGKKTKAEVYEDRVDSKPLY